SRSSRRLRAVTGTRPNSGEFGYGVPPFPVAEVAQTSGRVRYTPELWRVRLRQLTFPLPSSASQRLCARIPSSLSRSRSSRTLWGRVRYTPELWRVRLREIVRIVVQ